MLGIRFDGHPNLRRILMEDDWEGHPLRKDYPIGGEPVRFSGESSGDRSRTSEDLRRHADPLADPDACSRSANDLRPSDDVLTVNFGPNHPSTHGVLRLVVDLHGEEVVGLAAVVGYLHTGFEKSMEQKSWWKAITYAPRIDYVVVPEQRARLRPRGREAAEIEVPARATWMRMLLAELNRIHSHLVWLGTAALELGAISMFWYCFRERDRILDLFELVAGFRMHTRYFQVGGLAEDIPPGFCDECAKFVERDAEGSRRLRVARRPQRDLARAHAGASACSPRTTRSRSGSPARCCAARASTGISGGRSRIWPTTRSTSACPSTRKETSTRATACGWRRCASPSGSSTRRCGGMPGGPWIADDRKVVLPPREELHTSMESLIHHFKIVTEGFRVPEGEVYVTVESPRGELGCYVVSDGGPKPWRVKFRAPSFVALAGDRDVHERRADRRHDRRSSARSTPSWARSTGEHLLRRGPGDQGAVSELALGDPAGAAARAGEARLPVRRRRCASAPTRSARRPAFCEAVASFYDMLHLAARRPAHGRGLHERVVRARRRAAGARALRGGARHPRRARRPRTARSRCGRSSASAAAAGRRSSRSTITTART